MRLATLLVLAFLSAMAGLSNAVEIRYDDVLYLDEAKMPPLELKVKARARLCFSRDPRSVIAYLHPDQKVQLIGLGEKMHYVGTRISTGPARGWVAAELLETPPPEVGQALKARREKMLAHRELIARHEVAIGMIREEVLASLGKPDQKSRTRTADSHDEQWTYTTYRYLPRYTHYTDEHGRLRQLVSYQRVASGQKVIVFAGEEVVQIDDFTDDKPVLPPSSVIVPPLEVQ